MGKSKKEPSIIPQAISLLAGKFKRNRSFHLPGDVINSAKILFIGSDDILELLFIYPVVEYFRKNYPDIKKTILVDRSLAEAAAKLLPVESVITYRADQMRLYKKGFIKLLKALKKEYFETCILLGREASMHNYILAFLSGAVTRIGFGATLSFPYINCEIVLSGGERYIGKRYSGIINSIGLKGGSGFERLSLKEKDLHRAEQLIHFRKPRADVMTIGVDPGHGREKRYVIPEILAFLVNNLAARMKSKVLILTEPWEARLVREFSSEIKCDRFDLEPENSYQAINLLACCDLFISANTTLFHFASALGVPTIGLFTEGESVRWVPDRNNVRIFRGRKGEKLSLKEFFGIVEDVLG
ncbi:MAG: glycosyltransferase family 9 protein [Candidatus Krumholzibacteriales bacterium]